MIDVWPDYVIAFGVRIERPERILPSQWESFWEKAAVAWRKTETPGVL